LWSHKLVSMSPWQMCWAYGTPNSWHYSLHRNRARRWALVPSPSISLPLSEPQHQAFTKYMLSVSHHIYNGFCHRLLGRLTKTDSRGWSGCPQQYIYLWSPWLPSHSINPFEGHWISWRSCFINVYIEPDPCLPTNGNPEQTVMPCKSRSLLINVRWRSIFNSWFTKLFIKCTWDQSYKRLRLMAFAVVLTQLISSLYL